MGKKFDKNQHYPKTQIVTETVTLQKMKPKRLWVNLVEVSGGDRPWRLRKRCGDAVVSDAAMAPLSALINREESIISCAFKSLG
jgi:hypothetical protein